MQKVIKIAAAMAVSILYGLAVFHIYGMLSIQIDHSAFLQKNRTENVFIAEAEFSEGFALPAKLSFATEAGGPSAVSNSQLHKLSAVFVKAAGQNFSGSYSRYIAGWLNMHIGLSISDIIFPFHYFW
jgi:hypothetical protein